MDILKGIDKQINHDEGSSVENLVLYASIGQTSNNENPLSDVENIRLAKRIVYYLSFLDQDEDQKLLRVYDIGSDNLTKYFNPSNLDNFGDNGILSDNPFEAKEFISEGLIREGYEKGSVVLTVPSFMIPNPSNSVVEKIREGKNGKVKTIGLERRILSFTESLIFQCLDDFVSSEEIKVPASQVIQPDIYMALSTNGEHTHRAKYVPQ